MASRLVVVHGADSTRGAVRVLGDQPIRIGRVEADAQAAWALDDPEISRSHTRVESNGSGGFLLRDLGSHNGTYVNGERATVHPLRDGDVVRMGGHLLVMQSLTAEECDVLLTANTPVDGALVGSGPRMLAVHRAVAHAARTDAAVLLQGESGVGKELVARAIHTRSGRPGAFVAVNCAALPGHLAESELFGHVRGAFTGAGAPHPGLFAHAEGGTLLLDEIGAMPLELQAKLLRALALGEVRHVGASEARRIQVKVIAATNVVLKDAVERGSFRGDLYSRLMGAVIDVPPLRRRREDILELCRHFFAQLGCPVTIAADAGEALLIHSWPYNVRELEQLCGHVATFSAESQILRIQALPEEYRRKVAERTSSAGEWAPPALLSVPRNRPPSRDELVVVLAHFRGSVKDAADFFRKDRRQIYRWSERLGIDPEQYR